MRQRFISDRRRVIQAICGSAALSGCGLLSHNVLDEPPGWYDTGRRRKPVVFLHGAFGARLRHRHSGEEIWPIGVPSLLVGSYRQLELPLDPDSGAALPDDIIADGLFEEAGVVDFYGSLITMLVAAGGYRHGHAGTPVSGDAPQLYSFLYDWRRDLSQAAVQLDAFIEQIRADHGDPALNVDLVAHSSGGLLARYFLLYGGRALDQADSLPPDFAGCSKAARVVAIGVPELGMTRAAAALLAGEPVVLNRVDPEVLATAESPFQLLPQPDNAWLLDDQGRPVEADSCDIEVWRQLRMSVFDPALRSHIRHAAGGRRAGESRLALMERAFGLRLDLARRFHLAVRAAPVPAGVPYFSIGGDCRPTQQRLMMEKLDSGLRVRARPEEFHRRTAHASCTKLMLAPGDGMVTRSSLTCEPDWPIGEQPVPIAARNWRSRDFVCASHNQLVVNVDCQRALLRALNASLDPAPADSAAPSG